MSNLAQMIAEFKCMFCGKNASVIRILATNELANMHDTPSCQQFDDLDADEYLRLNNEHYAKLNAQEFPLALTREEWLMVCAYSALGAAVFRKDVNASAEFVNAIRHNFMMFMQQGTDPFEVWDNVNKKFDSLALNSHPDVTKVDRHYGDPPHVEFPTDKSLN